MDYSFKHGVGGWSPIAKKSEDDEALFAKFSDNVSRQRSRLKRYGPDTKSFSI